MNYAVEGVVRNADGGITEFQCWGGLVIESH